MADEEQHNVKSEGTPKARGRPRKSVGRPRKSPASADKPPEVNPSNLNLPVNDAVEPKKRGRRKQADVSSVREALSESLAVKQNTEDTPEAKKRGRPKKSQILSEDNVDEEADVSMRGDVDGEDFESNQSPERVSKKRGRPKSSQILSPGSIDEKRDDSTIEDVGKIDLGGNQTDQSFGDTPNTKKRGRRKKSHFHSKESFDEKVEDSLVKDDGEIVFEVNQMDQSSEGTPYTKKRGRPKKSSPSLKESFDGKLEDSLPEDVGEIDLGENKTDKTPVTKRRGRPKKKSHSLSKKPASTMVEGLDEMDSRDDITDQSVVDTPVTRKKAQPRRSEVLTDGNVDEHGSTMSPHAQGAGVIKRRGRPKKSQTIMSPGTTDEQTDVSALEAVSDSEPHHVDEPNQSLDTETTPVTMVTKKRGRPKKKKKLPPKNVGREDHEDLAADMSPNNVDREDVAADMATSDDVHVTPLAGELNQAFGDCSGKRKRGRPRKSQGKSPFSKREKRKSAKLRNFEEQNLDDSSEEKPTKRQRRSLKQTTYCEEENSEDDEEDDDGGTSDSEVNRSQSHTPRAFGRLKGPASHGPFTCVHCSEVYPTRVLISRHMLKEHYRVWDPYNHEGVVNVTRYVKVFHKIECKACHKEFRFATYYQSHLKWCGKEDEMTTCSICGAVIKAQWFKNHEARHAKSDKAREDQQKLEQAGNQNKRRSAAVRALKTLKDLDSIQDNAGADQGGDSSDGYEDGRSSASSEDYDGEVDGEGVRREKPIKRSSLGLRMTFPFRPLPWPEAKKLMTTRCQAMENIDILTSWQPRIQDWELLNDRESLPYLPLKKSSMHFKVSEGNFRKDPVVDNPDIKLEDLDQLDFTSVKKIKDGWLGYVGGPIWALDWCPCPVAVETTQYIALYCHQDPKIRTPLNHPTTGSALVQLWNCGKLDNQSEDETKPFLDIAIATDNGSIMDLKWCPHGAWSQTTKRLGLLAVVTSSGQIDVYSVPHTDALPRPDQRDAVSVYRATPTARLSQALDGENESVCMCAAWQVKEDSTKLAAGYSNGTVSVWDLSVTSPLLQSVDTAGILTRWPSRTFWAHSGPITSVQWCPLVSHMLISVSHDRQEKLWDLRHTDQPVFSHVAAKLHTLCCPDYWPTIITGGDDCFNYGANSSHVMIVRSQSFTHRPLTTHDCTIWSITYSPWIHAMAVCDSTGSVTSNVFQPLTEGYVNKSKGVSKYRVPLVHTLVSSLADQEDKDLDVMSEVAMETNGTSDTEEKKTTAKEELYLDYVLYSNPKACLTDTVPKSQREDVKLPPLRALHKITYNCNSTSYRWMGMGGQAGMLFIRRINLK